MSAIRPLIGKIALVTGASRGIGKGIALQLGQAGATVYITGRKPEHSLLNKYSEFPTLEKTAEEVRMRDTTCHPVYCDHSNPDEIKSLFEKISNENNGTLDILVNSAYSAVNDMGEAGNKKFYECDPLFWDNCNNVGLRNNYICCTLAARMMVEKKSGLIINISSAGGLQYTMNVAYGVGKAGVDRLAADMAVELKGTNVSIVTVWPGPVSTEMFHRLEQDGKVQAMTKLPQEVLDSMLGASESPEFTGKAIVALATDARIQKKTGRIFLTYDLAKEYGFKDLNGKLPMNMRSLSSALSFLGWTRLASFIPSFITVPTVFMHMASYKF
ncbi:unnamed protein product [Auanema sp. JU1783]|nr:unnamed protein product [Auanema sp. JU1783]